MRIQLGEPILTADGQEAGRVEKLILDPDHSTVDSVVLRKGAIFGRDVEVTLDQITEDTAGMHRLTLGSARLNELPSFDESKYTTPPANLVLPFDDPRDAVLWPAGFAGTPMPAPTVPFGGDRELAEEVVAGLYEQDLENAVIVSGSAVVSQDGKKIGELASLSFSDTDGRLSSLVVRHGFLFPTVLELSGSLVESAGDGVLYLNVDSEEIKELADER
jgi:sporulation protein YlmC with PRC-barrel domain